MSYTIKKYGARIPFSWEVFLESTGSEKPRGHYEPDPMTREELREYRKAKRALKTLKSSPWARWDREEGYILEPKRTRKWVRDV